MIHSHKAAISSELRVQGKKQQHRENRNWKPTLYSHYEWPPRASSWTSTCTSTPGRQCECPMLRSMPLTVANFLLLSPGATATTTPFICSGDYSLRQVGFFLNTSSFRFVPRHLAAILCQFPVHCVWVSLAPWQTHKQNQILPGRRRRRQVSSSLNEVSPPSPSLSLHLAECQV